jgi:hypothetical protein
MRAAVFEPTPRSFTTHASSAVMTRSTEPNSSNDRGAGAGPSVGMDVWYPRPTWTLEQDHPQEARSTHSHERSSSRRFE